MSEKETIRLTDEQLRELEELEGKATGAPWRTTADTTREDEPVDRIYAMNYRQGQILAKLWPECGVCDGFDISQDDGRFIVAARNNILSLLREVRELREVVGKLPKTADGIPITPGMKLFGQEGLELVACRVGVSTRSRGHDLVTRHISKDAETMRSLDWSHLCYSTRELAIAASSLPQAPKTSAEGGKA